MSLNFRHPIPRSGKPIKRSPIKKRPRKKAETLRIYGPPGYVEWIHEQPCITCGYWVSECAHIKTGGTGRKDDWTRTVPLCGNRDIAGCHAWLHIEGRKDFEEWHGIDLEAEAAEIQKLWALWLEDTETT